MPVILPPPRNGVNGKGRRIVRHSYVDMALVPCNVVDTKGDGPALGGPWEVMLVDFFCLPAPRSPFVHELTNQFRFLGIDTDDGQTGREEPLFLGGDVLELFVPFGASQAALLPLVGFQREAHLLEQAGDGVCARLMSFLFERFA